MFVLRQDFYFGSKECFYAPLPIFIYPADSLLDVYIHFAVIHGWMNMESFSWTPCIFCVILRSTDIIILQLKPHFLLVGK